jgi:hypothetical protein
MSRTVGFDTRRFLLIIRNEITLNRANFLIFAAVVWGVLLLNLVIRMNGPKDALILGPSYGIFVFISGLIMTEKAFKDLHDQNKGAAWLTLPASMFEKYVSRVAYAIVASTAGIMFLFFLFSLISKGFIYLIFGSLNTPELFNPFSKDMLVKTLRCWILLSPFQLGIIYFKKRQFSKTFVSILAYQLLLVLIVVVGLKIFISDVQGQFSINFPPEMIPNLFFENNSSLAQAWSIVKWSASIVFWSLFAPFCWVTGYIRLKETEV